MICSWSNPTLAYLIEDHLDDLLLVQPHPRLLLNSPYSIQYRVTLRIDTIAWQAKVLLEQLGLE